MAGHHADEDPHEIHAVADIRGALLGLIARLAVETARRLRARFDRHEEPPEPGGGRTCKGSVRRCAR